MEWINSLERRCGHLGIPGLTRIVVAFNALVYVLSKLNPGFLEVIEFDPGRILHGEVWRLVTYLFIPRFGSFLLPEPLAVAFYLYFVWLIGEQLEQVWGAFKLTLYYLLGMIGMTVAAFVFGNAFSNLLLNSALFFAFARFFPDTVFYIMFVLPMKVKWLAWISAAFLILQCLTSDLGYLASVVVALGNYLLFFGPEIYRDARHRQGVAARRKVYVAKSVPESEPLHRCKVCDRTELSHPELTFRVARDGEDYCVEHLPRTPAN